MKYAKYILSIVIPFLIVYLIGSLAHFSFNLHKWKYEQLIVSFIIGVIFAIYFLIHNLSMDLSGLNNIEAIEPEIVEADGTKNV